MDYYLEAFKKVLLDIEGVKVRILSNYSDEAGVKPLFKNQYEGNIIRKGFSLLENLRRLKNFIKKYPDGIYVYLTYGNSIDLPFINIIRKVARYVIDIHEAIGQDVDSDKSLRKKFSDLYGEKVAAVISHSPRTDAFLQEFGFKGKRFSVPHFRYVYPKEFVRANIPAEVLDSISSSRINVLFFGNLNESKGVDILLEAFNLLDAESAAKLNLIVAGKDYDGSVDRVKPREDRSVHIFRRHISDDELRYLYSGTDYIALPYRKTSQSGILETAFYFKKPIIASDVEYFRLTLKEFPSFGVLGGCTPRAFSETLKKWSPIMGERSFISIQTMRAMKTAKKSMTSALKLPIG